ncbi:hypothetical protein AB0G05_45045 [Nonomuraea wenchangensis]
MSTDNRPDPSDGRSPPERPLQTDGSRRLAERAGLADAALATQGKAPVTVVHSEPDCDEDMRLICEILPALAEQAGPPSFRQGDDDTTYVFAPPGAAEAAAAFETEVRASFGQPPLC